MLAVSAKQRSRYSCSLCTGVGNTLRLFMRGALLMILAVAQQPKCRR